MTKKSILNKHPHVEVKNPHPRIAKSDIQPIPNCNCFQKTSISGSTPITILRPASGGKPVFLRTLSVSNVHLVRVSDILSNAKPDGDQPREPPRASSAPPSRNDLVTCIPRPNSVGPRILIPTSQVSCTSPSPSGHFLSKGDPSSCTLGSTNKEMSRAGATTANNTISSPHQYIIFKPNSVISKNIVSATTKPQQEEFPNHEKTFIETPAISSQSPSEFKENPSTLPPVHQVVQCVGTPNNAVDSNIAGTVVNNTSSFPVTAQPTLMAKPQVFSQQQASVLSASGAVYRTPTVPSGVSLNVFASNNQVRATDDNSDSDEGCPCNMMAMVACVKCGAFCHQDCVSANRLCVTCLIR